MLIKECLEKVDSIFQLKNDVFFKQGSNEGLLMKNYFQGDFMPCETYMYGINEHIYRTEDGVISVYDIRLNLLFELFDKRIRKGRTGIKHIEDSQIVWTHSENDDFKVDTLCVNEEVKCKG